LFSFGQMYGMSNICNINIVGFIPLQKIKISQWSSSIYPYQ
jgi:hypothetical protein